MRNRPPTLLARYTGGKFANYILFGVTAVELCVLFIQMQVLEFIDWLYISSHVLVLAFALVRRQALEVDNSIGATAAVVVSYSYAYAQVIVLQWIPGEEAWPAASLPLVFLGTCLELACIASLGRLFGIRPARRGVATRGPYRAVRHPLYFAYFIADIGYNLQEWSYSTLILVASGWLSLIYRIDAEERLLSNDPKWSEYTRRVRYRLLPGIW